LKVLGDGPRAEVEAKLRRFQDKVVAAHFWKGVQSGKVPEDIKDLRWLPALAENLIDGSLSKEMMNEYARSQKTRTRRS